MKIFYDHTVFARQKYGGISKYFCELLKKIPKENWYLSILLSNNQYLKDSKLLKTMEFFPNLNFKGKERLLFEFGRPYTLYKLHKENWDIFHPTLYANLYINNIPKNKIMVVTAHDTLYCLFHENNPKRKMMINWDMKAYKRANKIIAISENTKKDIIKYFGVEPEKINVIHHGINKKKFDILDMRIESNPYILFVGIRYEYKNFFRFAEAFSILSKKYPNLKLVCTGFPFDDREQQELSRLRIYDKTRLIYATEQQMAQLYHNAEMFVFPSLYEGFGMPILEAFAYDCPVVLSNTSCFPEVAQNAGLYFNPCQVEDIVLKMEQVLTDSQLRKDLIKLGRERLIYFSWEETAEKHLEVYRSLL